MRRAIGALFGLLALAAYGLAGADMLGAAVGQDLLAGLAARLPDDVVAWRAHLPFTSGEGAPDWRTAIVGIALGVGAAGGILEVGGSRLSALSLWLSFLLLAGVFVGQDLVLGGGLATAERDDLLAGAGALGATFLLALIAQAATARRKDDSVEISLHAPHERELAREPGPPPPPPSDSARERVRVEARTARRPPIEPAPAPALRGAAGEEPEAPARARVTDATYEELGEELGPAERPDDGGEPDGDVEVVEAEVVENPKKEDEKV